MVGHAVDVLLSMGFMAAGSAEAAAPAARALLSTLAKLLARADEPGFALGSGLRVRCAGACSTPAAAPQRRVIAHALGGHAIMRASARPPMTSAAAGRQDALYSWTPNLLRLATIENAVSPLTLGQTLPEALLPYAAAQLLPLLLLPPERVRALDLPHLVPAAHSAYGNHASIFLANMVVSAPQLAARPLMQRLSHARRCGRGVLPKRGGGGGGGGC